MPVPGEADRQGCLSYGRGQAGCLSLARRTGKAACPTGPCNRLSKGVGPCLGESVSILVEDYHKTYGDTVAVAGISFAVEPGEVLGLVGPNGAGKTTTLLRWQAS